MRVKPAGVDSCTQTNALDNQGLSIRFKKDTTKVQKLVAAVRGYEKS
jgi:phosphoribosylanthranilate isomerase